MRPRWASWKVTSGGKCEHQGTAATSVEAHGGSHHYPCCLAPQCLRLGCAGQQEFKEAMAEEGCRRLPGMYPGCEDHHRALGAIWEYCARRSVKISSVWYICPPKISETEESWSMGWRGRAEGAGPGPRRATELRCHSYIPSPGSSAAARHASSAQQPQHHLFKSPESQHAEAGLQGAAREAIYQCHQHSPGGSHIVRTSIRRICGVRHSSSRRQKGSAMRS